MAKINNISNCCNDNCCDECIYVTTVNVSCYRTTLPVGESCFVRATPKPDNATNQKVTWSSSDNAIATVNPDSGLVTAQSVGTVVITATAVDRSIVSGTYVIEIVPYVFVQSLTVLNPELTMHPDGRERVDILMTPSNATNFSVKWCSSNECVATVDGLGVVKTHNVGEAIITVRTTDGSNLCATCRVIVEPVPVEAVTIESTSENMNVGDEKEIVATICPENATNKTIKWHSTNENVATVGTYTGKVTAHKAGTAEIVATTVDGNFVDYCKVVVKSTDPFHHSNVEYVRIKKWRSEKTTDGINYTECDMSTTATKSYIDDLTYFTVFFPDEDEITTFEINNTLINQLNNIESQYQSQFFKQGRPLCFHKGKVYADGFVSEGKIEYASPEYYGIWAYNGNAVCEINDRLSFAFALATTAYSGFMYGFTKVMSMQSMQMSAGQTKTYNNSQYMDIVESQEAIADISDDVAIQLGKTDITSSSTTRRSWRASEMRVAEDYSMSSGFEYNKSYKIVNGRLVQVPHGTAGSQRPDFYNPATNQIIEVKNYTVTTQTGRNNLANNIATQYNNRKAMFSGAHIEFKVDVCGQSYTQSMLDDILDLVRILTDGEDIVNFIYD